MKKLKWEVPGLVNLSRSASGVDEDDCFGGSAAEADDDCFVGSTAAADDDCFVGSTAADDCESGGQAVHACLGGGGPK